MRLAADMTQANTFKASDASRDFVDYRLNQRTYKRENWAVLPFCYRIAIFKFNEVILGNLHIS